MESSRSIGSVSRLLVLAAATATILAALADVAAAQRRVAVMEFSGARAKTFQRAVVGIVDEDYRVIKPGQYSKAAREVGARSASPGDLRKVAAELGADAVIEGKVGRARGGYRVMLRVRSGKTGMPVGKPVSAVVKEPRLEGKARQFVRKKLKGLISDVPRVKRRRARRDNRDNRRSRRVERDEPDDDDDEDDDRDDDDDEDDDRNDDRDDDDIDEDRERRRALPGAGRTRSIVVLGVGGSTRNLSFDGPGGDLDPPGYSSSVVPMAHLSAEFYPLKKGKLQALGVSGVFERVLSIKSGVDGMPDITLPTTQQRYGIGLAYAHRLGKKRSPTATVVTVSARYNRAEFTIDRTLAEDAGVDIDVPNVGYEFIDPGLSVSHWLRPKTRVGAEARGMLFLDLGEIQTLEQYGRATVLGFEARVFAEQRVKPNLTVRVGAQLTSASYEFKPDPAGVPPRLDRDGDGAQDVSGAVDRTVSGFAGVGYLF